MPASLTKLGYWNKALYKIGAARLNSTDVVNTAPASQFLTDIDPQCVAELLEEGIWSFAVQTVYMIPLNPPVWVTDTSYAVGNFIQIGSLIYRCIVAHTSGVFATDLGNGDWLLQTGAVPILQTLPSMNDGVNNLYLIPSDFVKPYLFSSPAFYRIETVKPPFVTTTQQVLLTNDATINAMKYVFYNTDTSTWTAKFYEAMACKLAYELCFKISEAAQWAAKCEAGYNKALMSALGTDALDSSPDEPIANEWFIARLAGSTNVAPWGITPGSPNPEPYF